MDTDVLERPETDVQAKASDNLGDGKIVCHIDGARVAAIAPYIKKHHPDWTIERYKEKFPGEPLMSEETKILLEKRKRDRDLADKKSERVRADFATSMTGKMQVLADTFGLPRTAKGVKNGRGDLINIMVYEDHDEISEVYVPDVDPNYVFDVDMIRMINQAMTKNFPILLWGYHGTGKTTNFEQFCARTKRPFYRVQHTMNTEESHIIGQYVVRREGDTAVTHFELGPLALAMKYGWVYCADEYDVAMPSVIAVYQPVLEGKPLIIKEAPIEMRLIRPHPEFRFVATGNTNGSGDETGLYQGTQIQNAANYSRFPIVHEVEYMDKKQEKAIVAAQAGIDEKVAGQFVDIATDIRKSFAEGKMSMTISPRELINAGKNGLLRGNDWKTGLMWSFGNRLPRVEKATFEQLLQRRFGDE